VNGEKFFAPKLGKVKRGRYHIELSCHKRMSALCQKQTFTFSFQYNPVTASHSGGRDEGISRKWSNYYVDNALIDKELIGMSSIPAASLEGMKK